MVWKCSRNNANGLTMPTGTREVDTIITVWVMIVWVMIGECDWRVEKVLTYIMGSSVAAWVPGSLAERHGGLEPVVVAHLRQLMLVRHAPRAAGHAHMGCVGGRRADGDNLVVAEGGHFGMTTGAVEAQQGRPFVVTFAVGALVRGGVHSATATGYVNRTVCTHVSNSWLL